MTDLEYLICPNKHSIPFIRDVFARDYSDGDVDAMTGQPMYEIGLHCLQCDKDYGSSKLKSKSEDVSTSKPL